MEILVILAIVVVVGPWVLAIIALAQVGSQRAEIAVLRRKVASLDGAARSDPEQQGAAVAPSPPAAPAALQATPQRDAASPVTSPTAALPSAALPPAAAAPAQGAGFEELLTRRWGIWIGALALGLGGVFMVRYSIEQGLLGPAARCVIGALLGAALLAGSVVLRRRLQPDPGLAPAALAAGGLVALYAAGYAAYALYGLMPAWAAFAALAATAFVGLSAALLHGQLVAVLAAVLGYATPALVATEAPNLQALSGYLVALSGSLLAVLRWRAWTALVGPVLAASLVWQLIGQSAAATIADRLALAAHLLAVPAMAVRLHAWQPTALPARLQALLALLTGPLAMVLAAGAGSWLLILTLVIADAQAPAGGALAWCAWLPALAAALALAWRSPVFLLLPALGSALAPLLLLAWPIGPPEVALWPIWGNPAKAVPAGRDGLLALAALLGAMPLAVATAAMLLRRTPTGAWAALGAAAALLAMATAYARVTAFDSSALWAAAALALAALFVTLAAAAQRRQEDAALAAFAVGAVAALCLAFACLLRDAWLSVALATPLPAIAWIERRIPLPALRWTAGALAAAVLARLIVNPAVLDYPIAATPVANWLIVGYGLPALACAAAVRLFRARADDGPVQVMEAAAYALALALVTLECRHLASGGSLAHDSLGLLEAALVVDAWLAFAWLLLRAESRGSRPVRGLAWRLVAAIGAAGLLLGPLLALNPLQTGDPVGTAPIANLVQLAFGVPALLLGLLASELARQGMRQPAAASGIAALGLAVLAAGLEVRRAFVGPVLAHVPVGESELYAYSIAWLALGAVLLAAGLWRGVGVLRLGGLIVVALTVAKVFLLDMAELTGLLRALSFLGLGLALIAIGLAYQRFLRGPRDSAANGTPPA
ncbi:MAG: DUF2339 domain-containing protein [Alphaproteobacteria bacterium]|nr:DUF2339 domain-containing protein [Alphaproteobacteria bacterium]